MLTERRHGAVAVIALDDPATRNSLGQEMRRNLVARIEAIEADETVRAVVLTGAGGTFSSGGNLREMEVPDLAAGRARFALSHRLIRLIAGSAKPYVAVVEGWAAGAGMSLACACDVVVAAPDARFSASFGRAGLIGDLGILHFLPQRVGKARARRILLYGETLDAREAGTIGLADHVASAGEAQARGLALAGQLAEQAPLALALTKSLLNDDLESLLERERTAQAALFLSEDHAEGKRAFFEKRKPNFSGR